MDEATLRVACRFADESEQMADAIVSERPDDPGATAGDSPLTGPSYRAAIAWFDDNLPEVLGLLGALRAAEEWELAFRLGNNLILYLLRRRSWDQAEHVALLAADAALRSERPDREAQVLQAVGIARQMKGDDRGADEVFHRLEVLLQQHGDDLRRAQLLAQWAQTKRRFGDVTRANAMLRRSIDLYRAAGSVGGQGRSLGNLANLLDDEGAATAALEMYEQAVALFRNANLAADLALALRNLGQAYARRGVYDLALRALGDSRAVSRSLGDDRQEADAAWLEAQVHWQNDRIDAAVASARFVSERGDARVALEAKSMLGAAELLQGLEDFIAADDDDRRTAVITRHPALLSPSADHLLAERIETARSDRSEARIRHLMRGREALARYRSEQLGREVERRWAALEHIASPGSALPGRLKPIVALLSRDTDPDRRIALLGEAMGVLGDTQPMVRARLLSEVGRAVLDARDDAPAREQAIAALEEALALWDRDRDPEGWAALQDALGRAYRNRSLGNPGENVERAIGCFRAALSVYRRRTHREGWVTAVTNLANAYRSREKGDRATNMERAIRRYEAVIAATTVDESPRLRALVHGNLGYTYADRVLGNLAENVEDAIRYLGRALDGRAELNDPEVVAMLLNRSYALRKRVEGDRTDNIERAIQDLDAALAEARRAGLRLLEAQAASNLGAAWDDRRAGNAADNIEKAIEWYQIALEVQSREATPAAWAATVDNLANAYSRRSYGRADKNLDRAIELHESALSVYSPEFQPIEWARALHNLATSLLRRHGPSGRPADRAIDLYRQALTVRRRESTPFDWAETTDALARALALRGGTEPVSGDFDEAIVRYREALEVFDPGLIPDRARTTATSLGSLHAWLGQWSEAAAAFRLAVDAGERLYRSSILRASKDLELSESGDLARRAAYALARCSDLTGAVTVLEVGRARALREALERDRVRLTAAEGEDAGAVEAYAAAVERLRRLETAQRVSGGSTGEPSPGGDQRALVAEHRDAQAELDTALERIRRLPGFERLLMAPSFSDVGEAALA
ncbi:MAG: tetratricopeptide repeat protein, partial [Acidimicrobiia bacterium]